MRFLETPWSSHHFEITGVLNSILLFADRDVLAVAYTVGPVKILSPSSRFWSKIHQIWSRIPREYVERVNN
jgi:hypothetical protein